MITKNAGVKLAPLLENKYKFIVKYITLVSSLYHLRNSADYQTKFTKFRINYFEKGCWNPELFEIFMEYRKNNDCAADFALLNLPKGKSLGRSKPATNSSNEQAH